MPGRAQKLASKFKQAVQNFRDKERLHNLDVTVSDKKSTDEIDLNQKSEMTKYSLYKYPMK